MRTKTIKKASRVIIEKYYGRLTMDFDTNKRVIEDIASVPSKRLRNKIAGFTTVRVLLAIACGMLNACNSPAVCWHVGILHGGCRRLLQHLQCTASVCSFAELRSGQQWP